MNKKTFTSKVIILGKTNNRMLSTQVGDNIISEKKIYKKLVEDENCGMQDILEVNKSTNHVINRGYIYLYEDSVKNHYIEGNAKTVKSYQRTFKRPSCIFI